METIDYKALAFWIQAAQFFGTIIGFIWLIISNKQKANASAIEAVDHKVEKETKTLDSRLTKIETKLQHMPGHDDLGEIHTRVNEAAQRLTSMEGELKQMNNTMQLMHRHLLNGGK